MRKIILGGGVAAMALALSGCGGGGGLFDRARPDEFAVSRQAPLVIPPDFAMVPPAPGAAPTQGVDPSGQALDALFGGPSARSATESGAVNQAGSSEAGIRSDVGSSKPTVVNKGAATRDIIAAPEGDGQGARASTGG